MGDRALHQTLRADVDTSTVSGSLAVDVFAFAFGRSRGVRVGSADERDVITDFMGGIDRFALNSVAAALSVGDFNSTGVRIFRGIAIGGTLQQAAADAIMGPASRAPTPRPSATSPTSTWWPTPPGSRATRPATTS